MYCGEMSPLNLAEVTVNVTKLWWMVTELFGLEKKKADFF